MKILGYLFERCFGGCDFDEVLFEYFVVKFKEELKIDVKLNVCVCLRFCSGCEKVKKILSVNFIVLLNIECLMDEKDVKGVIKCDEFEELVKGILEKVRGFCERVLVLLKLSIDKLFVVEVVGFGF